MLDKTRDELVAADDTIVALATPAGRSGIGVVRISGPAAVETLNRFFRSREIYASRRARLGSFTRADSTPLDNAVVTVFEGPRSYTGEDVAEISVHGNPLILNEIVDILVSAGMRRARRGEFTMRAVRNGKMDLAQAEAVRDFVDAETMAQARVALGQMNGAIAHRLGPLRKALVAEVAGLEAGIDFAEDDIEPPAADEIADRVEGLVSEVRSLADSFDYGRLLTAGLLVAIAGRPNVGKSSLFNRLVSSDRVIVTDVPGTTRDVVTETIAIAGVPLRIADTAGLREAKETVEALGVQRSFETVADADLTLLVVDGSSELTEEDRALLWRLRDVPMVVIVNKQDLAPVWDEDLAPVQVHLSALTGEGMDLLRGAIEEWIGRRRPEGTDDFVLTNRRQHDALLEAATSLGAATVALRGGVPHEMVLVELYQALSSIGEVTGEVTNEDILDQIFSTFCIGK